MTIEDTDRAVLRAVDAAAQAAGDGKATITAVRHELGDANGRAVRGRLMRLIHEGLVRTEPLTSTLVGYALTDQGRERARG